MWVGTGFARRNPPPFRADPTYLHVLPADLTRFRPLLTALGVRDAFGASDYVRPLRGLADDAGGVGLDGSRLIWRSGCSTLRITPATPRRAGERGRRGPRRSLPVPDASGALVQASEVRFNDALARRARGRPPAAPQAPCKPRRRWAFDRRLALRGGVRGHRTAARRRSGSTRRSPRGSSTYSTRTPTAPGHSELVQNADDAGATEVRLLDQTLGGDKSLLGPKTRGSRVRAGGVEQRGVFPRGLSQHREDRAG